MNVFEALTSIVALMGVFLTSRGHIGGWIFGLIASAAYVQLFFSTKLFAEAGLQLVYVVMGVYGWLEWRRMGILKESRPILNIPYRQFVLLGILYPCMIFLLGYILSTFTDTDVAYADAAMGSGGLLITWMMAKRYIEHWICWIIIDIANAGLFVYKNLFLTAIVYCIFAIMAAYGWSVWKKQQQNTCIN